MDELHYTIHFQRYPEKSLSLILKRKLICCFTNMEFVELTSSHDELVHDIAFANNGHRFATCSSDKTIKIWDYVEEKSNWISDNIVRAHDESIWRLSWAHPEFGNLLASCSEDKTVCIWEEKESISQNTSTGNSENLNWQKRVTLSDSKRSVNDVKFSPRHLGLQVASASADGCVRIYEATDVFSLSYWQLIEAFKIEIKNSISGNSITDNQNSRDFELGLTCLSWNDCSCEPAKIAIGGYSKYCGVWAKDTKTGKWNEECTLGDQTGTIHDIAWAPAMGRSFHQIATANRDNIVKVYKLSRNAENLEYKSFKGGSDSDSYSSSPLDNPAVLRCNSPVWRVAWNATGTVLATSGDDGTMRLWRKSHAGLWQVVQELPFGDECLNNIL